MLSHHVLFQGGRGVLWREEGSKRVFLLTVKHVALAEGIFFIFYFFFFLGGGRCVDV